MNDGYKEVFLGPQKRKIPREWDKTSLGKISKVLDRHRVPLNSDEREKMKGDIPYYGANGVVDHIDDYLFDEKLLLIAEDGGHFEEHKSRPISYIIEGKSWVNNHAHILRINDGSITEWVYYSTVHKNILPYVHGSTRMKLNQKELKKIEIPHPPLPEQCRIAEILSTVDDAIQKTDEVIEKAERLKKGLMQDLLTKGIGHDEFKEVQIGPKTVEIPEEWEINNLGNLSKIIVPQRDKPKRFDGNIPWIRIEDLEGKYLDDSKSNKRVSKELIKQMNLRPYPEGTVLCSCSGNMGVCAITTSVLTSNQTFAGIVTNNGLNKEYIYYFLSNHAKILQTLATGTTIPYLNKGEFEKLNIPLPSEEEQLKISNMLSKIDQKIRKEKSFKKNLENLKKGLMQDLLTGKVRVN